MSDRSQHRENLDHPAYGVLRPVTSTAAVLLATNPSPMTLEGTNTWLLSAPGADSHIVVDPGPDDSKHLQHVADQGRVAQVLLTHGHPDHADGARRFADMTGAPVGAHDPTLRQGGAALTESTVVEAAGIRLRVLETPGHTTDSVCLYLEAPETGAPTVVLTGDTVLGAGTTVVAHPDGQLGDYLRSLRRLAELPADTTMLPGHGPEREDAAAVATGYLNHREQRLDQVREALTRLGPDATPRQVVEDVYSGIDRSLWPAAEQSTRAQLDYLRSR